MKGTVEKGRTSFLAIFDVSEIEMGRNVSVDRWLCGDVPFERRWREWRIQDY
jgi:hypothetical protein